MRQILAKIFTPFFAKKFTKFFMLCAEKFKISAKILTLKKSSFFRVKTDKISAKIFTPFFIKTRFLSQIFTLFFIITSAVFIVSCGTQREYYEPKKIQGKLSYDARLKSSIINSNLEFATLKNREVLSENGIIAHFKLEKGYKLLKFEEDEFVVADDSGNLKILDENSEELFSHKFDAEVLSVALNGDDYAALLADNTIILANRSLGIKMQQTLTAAPAQDARVASPHFMDTLVIFPSLDGKVIVVDKNSEKIVRDVIVSSGDFFNNVIYLAVVDDMMIAATATKIIVISSDQTFSYIEDIRNVALGKKAIYIFGKNGNIIKTNLRLEKQKEKKFRYAIYNEAIVFKNHLYVFEKTGYLIRTDLNLANERVWRLKGAVDEKGFMKKGKFYYDNKILNLP